MSKSDYDWTNDWRGYASREERDADLALERLRANAEAEARGYFEAATVRQKAEFDLSVATAVRLHGHGSMAHEATINLARAQFKHDTREARALYHRTVDCLLADGEVSDDLDYEWTRLTDPAKAAQMWPERFATGRAA